MPGSEIQAKLFFFGAMNVIFLRPEIPVQNFCAAVSAPNKPANNITNHNTYLNGYPQEKILREIQRT